MSELEKMIIDSARLDASKGDYRPALFGNVGDFTRVLYTKTYLAAREKMGLLNVYGPGTNS